MLITLETIGDSRRSWWWMIDSHNYTRNIKSCVIFPKVPDQRQTMIRTPNPRIGFQLNACGSLFSAVPFEDSSLLKWIHKWTFFVMPEGQGQLELPGIITRPQKIGKTRRPLRSPVITNSWGENFIELPESPIFVKQWQHHRNRKKHQNS